jgi:hypothetical protein
MHLRIILEYKGGFSDQHLNELDSGGLGHGNEAVMGSKLVLCVALHGTTQLPVALVDLEVWGHECAKNVRER